MFEPLLAGCLPRATIDGDCGCDGALGVAAPASLGADAESCRGGAGITVTGRWLYRLLLVKEPWVTIGLSRGRDICAVPVLMLLLGARGGGENEVCISSPPPIAVFEPLLFRLSSLSIVPSVDERLSSSSSRSWASAAPLRGGAGMTVTGRL